MSHPGVGVEAPEKCGGKSMAGTGDLPAARCHRALRGQSHPEGQGRQQMGQGKKKSPLGATSGWILAWDTGAQECPCTPGELGKVVRRVAADWELPLHPPGDIAPLRPWLLLRWDHTRLG